MTKTTSEISARADMSIIRYAMCWEDADVMLDALDVQPGDVCLSIASGGENSLSLLACRPAKVIAVDLSPAQIACLEIKCAAFRRLEYEEMLELLGARDSSRRNTLYHKLRTELAPATRRFWEDRQNLITAGIGSAGKFESYFALFRRYVLPLIHSRSEISSLFEPRSQAAREQFFREVWANRRWRWLLRLFFSRMVMGRLGRDPEFFRYAEGSMANAVLERMRHALSTLDPARNPYLQWIAFGRFTSALPHALRAENFELIRSHLDRLEWRLASLEATIAEAGTASIDRFNLSDIFEYLSESAAAPVFEQIARAGRSGGRIAYWNMMAPRGCPGRLRDKLHSLDELARNLLLHNKAAFYDALHIEAIV
jgi:S-adenosylmethionine-diacylglycerol 3-amino-3-carboxypropyl transferase